MMLDALLEERRDAWVWFVADGLLLQSRPLVQGRAMWE